MGSEKDKVSRRAATRLTVLFTDAPEKATAEVMEAIKSAKGGLPGTADALSISERSLDRILERHPTLAEVARAERKSALAQREAERGAEKAARKAAAT